MRHLTRHEQQLGVHYAEAGIGPHSSRSGCAHDFRGIQKRGVVLHRVKAREQSNERSERGRFLFP